MTDAQLKELADLRVAIQDLKYQLTQKHEEIEDRESAIYATGYWNGIAYKKLREISDEEILALWVKKNNLNGAKDILDFARAIMERCRIINGTDK